MNTSEEIRTIAKEMSARLRWYQEMGIDVWRQDAASKPVDRCSDEIPEKNVEPIPDAFTSGTDPLPEPTPAPKLSDIREEMGDCQRCKLAPTRTHLVFGTGNPDAELLFIGEGPGRDEDLQGEPFVGRAGQLLTKMIGAMGLSREKVYIANIIKCRPPHNRNPEEDEIAACRPFLEKQIAAIQPKVICALGTFAAQTLLETTTTISRLRGRFHDLHGTKVLPTFHPAYLLRNPAEKRRVWEDLQKIMAELGLSLPQGNK